MRGLWISEGRGNAAFETLSLEANGMKNFLLIEMGSKILFISRFCGI